MSIHKTQLLLENGKNTARCMIWMSPLTNGIEPLGEIFWDWAGPNGLADLQCLACVNRLEWQDQA